MNKPYISKRLLGKTLILPAIALMTLVGCGQKETTYTVKWLNYDATVLATQTYKAGATPKYEGAIPTKPKQGNTEYTFKGWSPEIKPVSANVEYIAQFDEIREYTVTWANYDGTVLATQTYKTGEVPVYTGKEPTKPAVGHTKYYFKGWAPEITPVSKNVTYIAQFDEAELYTVTWKNYDGTVLATNYVYAGDTPSYSGDIPTRPATPDTTYLFKGWDKELSPIKMDTTYTAQFYELTSTSDADYDGIPDQIDPEPTNNTFKDVVFSSQVDIKTNITIDYKKYFINGDNTKYDNDISKLGVFVANKDNRFTDGLFDPSKYGGATKAFFTRLGCSDILDIDIKASDYSQDIHDIVGVVFGHHVIEHDQKKTDMIFINISGTRNPDEWISNFDVGYDDPDYFDKTGESHSEWVDFDTKFHKGFGTAASRVLKNIKNNPQTTGFLDYIDKHSSNYADDNPTILFITGHSRGAATAGILGDYFENKYENLTGHKVKPFTYCYASPTTHDTDSLPNTKTIFNVINEDDMVPMVPLKQWNLDHLGSDPVSSHIKGTALETEYNTRANKKYECLSNLENIFEPLKGNRNELYKIDTSKDVNLGWTFKSFMTEAEADEQITEIKRIIKDELLVSEKWFEIVKKKVGDYWDVEVYNCKGSVLAVVNNVIENKYHIETIEDILAMIQNLRLIANPIYVKAIINFVTTSGLIDMETWEIHENAMQLAHDVGAYLILIENYTEPNK